MDCQKNITEKYCECTLISKILGHKHLVNLIVCKKCNNKPDKLIQEIFDAMINSGNFKANYLLYYKKPDIIQYIEKCIIDNIDLQNLLIVVKKLKISKQIINKIKTAIRNSPQLPPIITRMKNVAEFTKDATVMLVKNHKLLCCKTQCDRRWEYCSTVCKHFEIIKSRARCVSFPGDKEGCGCFLKQKVKFAAARCEYWDIIDRDYTYASSELPILEKIK